MDSYSKLVGLYWYCNLYHAGIGSWQYRYLSNTRYEPGPMRTFEADMEDWEVQEYFDKLVLKFEAN